jgi:transcription antitermination factor NusG
MCEDSAWWALYTRHQHEKAVAEMLSAKDLEVFLPLYESRRRWKDRCKTLSLPLFPGYLFVRGGLDRRLQVLTTPGVHIILSNGNHAAIIPEAEIQMIRKAVEGPSRVEPHPFLKCGEFGSSGAASKALKGFWYARRRCAVWFFPWTCWRSRWEWRLTLRMWNPWKREKR